MEATCEAMLVTSLRPGLLRSSDASLSLPASDRPIAGQIPVILIRQLVKVDASGTFLDTFALIEMQTPVARDEEHHAVWQFE